MRYTSDAEISKDGKPDGQRPDRQQRERRVGHDAATAMIPVHLASALADRYRIER